MTVSFYSLLSSLAQNNTLAVNHKDPLVDRLPLINVITHPSNAVTFLQKILIFSFLFLLNFSGSSPWQQTRLTQRTR